jgi:hypothetical protein
VPNFAPKKPFVNFERTSPFPVVQFPFYENDEFAGVVEFIAESALD